MSKSENILAFEAALKENKELQEKFAAAKARIFVNKEASADTELLIKAAAEVGYTLTAEELERALAEAQEINEEELSQVAGGTGENSAESMTGQSLSFDSYGCAGSFIGRLAL